MKAYVFIDEHQCYYLFFADLKELDQFWNIIKMSEEASNSVKIKLPEKFEEDFVGLVPVCVKKSKIEVFLKILRKEKVPTLLVSR